MLGARVGVKVGSDLVNLIRARRANPNPNPDPNPNPNPKPHPHPHPNPNPNPNPHQLGMAAAEDSALTHPALAAIAAAHGVSSAQVLQACYLVITPSHHP